MSDDQQPIEAEIVNTQAQTGLAVRQQSALPTVQDLEQQFALAVRQRELLSEYIKKQLQPGKHFYEIQGNKPSLTKEGAEIILLPHNLAPDYDIVSGPEAPPADGKPYQITVKCTLRRKGDPNSFVGSGIGSAGSEKQKRDGTYIPRQNDKYLCHNATIKMAEKSAMIAATCNSTAASEFFTQDIEPGETPQNAPGRAEAPKPPSQPTPAPKPPASPTPAPAPVATEATKAWMIKNLQPCLQQALQYFIEISAILPTEGLDAVPLRYVPTSKVEMVKLIADITRFAMEGKLTPPTPKAPAPEAPQPPASDPKAHCEPDPRPINVPREIEEPPQVDGDYELTQYPFNMIVPVPRKGMKRDAYMKRPDTIGSLFAMRHGQDEESQAARQRLWGFINHFEAKGWTDRQGQQRLPNRTDIDFRKALDVLADMMEKRGDKL